MTTSMVNIGKPTAVAKLDKTCILIIDAIGIALSWSFYTEISITILKTIPQPHSIFFDKRKDFFVSNSIHVTNNNKPLSCFHQPNDEFTEQRERRISHNDVSLVAESAYFLTTEIPVSLQILPLQIVDVDAIVARHITVKHEYLAVRLTLIIIEIWL